MIEISQLTKNYGSRHAVKNLSFNVNKGEVLGFIGPNGAGKSTTMRIITGFLPASGGKVKIAGQDFDSDPLAAKAKIGYLPENAPLYLNMTVTSFLRFCGALRGLSGYKLDKRVGEVITTCFLEPVKHQIIDTLSKGYRHRTGFAQAIIHDPDILILDEPTDGLDPNQKREVRSLIRQMGKDKAIILSTHILEEVEAVCNRVLVINRGEKVFDGSPEEFRGKAENAGTVIFEISGKNREAVSAKLESISNAKGFEEISAPEAEFPRYQVTPSHPDQSSELKDKLIHMADSENWHLRELHTVTGRLDEVFYSLTIGKDKESKSGEAAS